MVRERLLGSPSRGVTLGVLLAVCIVGAMCWCSGCNGYTRPEMGFQDSGAAATRIEAAQIVPSSGFMHVVRGRELKVSVRHAQATGYDSITLSLEGRKPVRVSVGESVLETEGWPMGIANILVRTWRDGYSVTRTQQVTIYADREPERYTYRRVGEYPHDRGAFTQGLLWANGHLYESTGQRGQSTLRRVDLRTGKVGASVSLAPSIFGEGLALLGNKFYQLSWTSRVGFIYDTATLERVGTFQFKQQGWGLASDGRWLYLTDGTENVYQMSPSDFQIVRTIQAYDHQGKQTYLNELEIIDGLLYANVFLTDEIVVIDLESGQILRRIDMSRLLPASLCDDTTDILNGIAHDASTGKTYVTGKNWPRVYEVEFVRR